MTTDWFNLAGILPPGDGLEGIPPTDNDDRQVDMLLNAYKPPPTSDFAFLMPMMSTRLTVRQFLEAVTAPRVRTPGFIGPIGPIGPIDTADFPSF